MTFPITFAKKENKKADTTVIGIFEENKLTDSAKEIDKREGGLIKACLKNNDLFKGKAGQTLVIPLGNSKGQKSLQRLVLVGLGKKKDINHLEFETIGGKLYQALKSASAREINIDLSDIEDTSKSSAAEITNHLALGLRLKSYRFDKYRAEKDKAAKKAELKTINIVTQANIAAKKLFIATEAIEKGVCFARDLVNEPPNTLHPESYAERIKAELKPLGVDVEILDEKKMQKLGFHSLLSVGQGSIRESRTVIMRWNGADKPKKGTAKKKTRAPLALVGKGVTFDTGGISLKPGPGMDLMKMDMGGSAAVVGTMKAIAGRKAKANVVGIVGLVENMPSDRAYRPGDIIDSYSGKTIEVLNTDAEGRLVLADILSYIQEKENPQNIIDLATLTGAIMVALGFEYAGAFANDDDLWNQLNHASQNTGEKLWRMPLDESYRKEMESDVADLKNLGGTGYGGACSAAGFLEHFINDGTKWAHIDIAGTAWWKTDKPTTPKGGTGFAVRALDDLIAHHFEK